MDLSVGAAIRENPGPAASAAAAAAASTTTALAFLRLVTFRTGMTVVDLLPHIFVLKALGWCNPGISAVGRSSLLAEWSSFSLFSCSTSSIFITNIYRFFMGITFSDDTKIRTAEDEAYKRTLYLLDHNVTAAVVSTSIIFFMCNYY